ncbi:hypothetical protein EG329_010497 [Mollisiaceae sp. DMI_Dod_QoI]|nr:hypothetical protein EG329_010497 [Helotiales sp. DMI_Dod_QoI]
MPLSGTSPTYLHVLQNASLILLSICCFPLCTFIAIVSSIISPYLKTSRHIQHYRKWRRISSSTFRPRTILVTGVGMSKGLTLARAFYRAGHRVIGADFEDYMIPVCGHFSKSIDTFYRLSRPSSDAGAAMYMKDMIDIIKKEGVELWVSCSGIASGVKDGEAAEMIEKETKCKAIQFGLTLTETLHEKHSFIDNTRELGLNVPDTHLVTSETESFSVLYPEKPRSAQGMKYVMKSVFLDDSSRADMTLLPRPTLRETEAHLKRLNPTPFRPFVLQKFISGPEYCTHSLVINGKVKIFVACPSADLLMHYVPLPTSSALSQAMLLYTTLYAKKTGPSMTGHFSIDFLVEADVAEEAERRVGVSDVEVRELMRKIYPIECNPRAHTAVVCLADESEDMAEAYLSILPDHEPKGISNGHRAEALVVPRPGIQGYYWVGHDLVTRVLLPLLQFLRFEIGVTDLLEKWLEFAEHVLYWRDGTFEIWDPWPFWWLYVGYWPAMFLVSLWEKKWWSRCNVSTQKMFGC